MTDDLRAIPPRLGNYIIKGLIGNGSFSVVRLAQHIETNRYCAVKIISRKSLLSKTMSERFETEIRVLQQMNHPNIVRLYEMIKDAQNYYIFMEFCPGGELFQYIVDRRFVPEEESRMFFRQIIEAIQYIHDLKATHRDLKPENILFSKTGQLKISDFGFARFLPEDNLVSTSCGSPCYAAPEMLEGKPYDGIQSDVWSTGVIFFAMLTGQLPWTKRNHKQLFEQIKKCEYKLPTFLSEQAQDLIKHILVADPKQRYTTQDILKHPFLTTQDNPASFSSNLEIQINLRHVDSFFKDESFYDDDLYVIRSNPSNNPLSFERVMEYSLDDKMERFRTVTLPIPVQSMDDKQSKLPPLDSGNMMSPTRSRPIPTAHHGVIPSKSTVVKKPKPNPQRLPPSVSFSKRKFPQVPA